MTQNTNVKEDITMSEEEIRNEINRVKSELIKIEQGTQNKVIYIKNKIEGEYNPKINEINSLLQVEQNKLDEINKKIQESLSEKKGLVARIKYLNKKDTTMKKEKTKKINEELKSI